MSSPDTTRRCATPPRTSPPPTCTAPGNGSPPAGTLPPPPTTSTTSRTAAGCRCPRPCTAPGRLDGTLTPEAGTTLAAALQPLMAKRGPEDDRTPGQRRADALLELVDIALRSSQLPDCGGDRTRITLVVHATETALDLLHDHNIPTDTRRTSQRRRRRQRHRDGDGRAADGDRPAATVARGTRAPGTPTAPTAPTALPGRLDIPPQRRSRRHRSAAQRTRSVARPAAGWPPCSAKGPASASCSAPTPS